MTPFYVLSPGRFIDRKGIDIAIKSFSNLYHNVTPKHQKRLRLIIIDEAENFNQLKSTLQKENIEDSVKIVNRINAAEAESVYKSASLFLFPSVHSGYKLICEALSYNLPVLTFQCSDVKDILDSSCSMLMNSQKDERAYEGFSKMLEMLYFDPEVRKILAKGAQNRHEAELSWG